MKLELDPNYLHWNLPSGRALILFDIEDFGFPLGSPLLAKVRFEIPHTDSKPDEWCECMVIEPLEPGSGNAGPKNQLAVIVLSSLNFVKSSTGRVTIVLDKIKPNLKQNEISKINFNAGVR